MLLEALAKKTAAAPDRAFDIIRQEMQEELTLDIDDVIFSEDPAGLLAGKGFSNEEMDALASLLMAVKGSLSMYRQGQIEILNNHLKEHF